ncbi:LysR family transcriptional regulator [Nocardioides sp.]|uniref:LysR family transcriptional regulator n=1 Tax=Nocardioides sp. TaxID=35761 RepID=UPI002D8025C9|nr:LysR family transcriptional regulator [Nocardioides sp.]HET8960119.1 LysR family transcriptional regulator [Nocardioides sp.]
MNDWAMDVRRLRLLLELSRLGSMREVADELGLTTSTVSQQIAALARETGVALLEPDGRRVRLTPAGRRLADHAVTILAAVDAARLDLDPEAEPAGTVRVGGFATAMVRSLLPVVHDLATTHPDLSVVLHEYEPLEAFDLLARDDLDLALVYDYDLAPISTPADVVAVPLWTAPWGLGVPAGEQAGATGDPGHLAAHADRPWIVNSRHTADEGALRTLASRAGFEPRVTHRIDSLDLVAELVGAGFGVALLPLDRAFAGVHVVPLAGTGTVLRAYAVVRRGRDAWPPLRLLLDRLAAGAARAAG